MSCIYSTYTFFRRWLPFGSVCSRRGDDWVAALLAAGMLRVGSLALSFQTNREAGLCAPLDQVFRS